MTQNALVLKGNLGIGGTNIATATDVSGETTAFKLSFNTDIIEVPATLSAGKRSLAGGVQYTVEIGYLSTDLADSVFSILYAAATSASKELFFVGSMRDGTVNAANPRYCGTLIVSAADLGADANALSTGTVTCVVKGAPTKETA